MHFHLSPLDPEAIGPAALPLRYYTGTPHMPPGPSELKGWPAAGGAWEQGRGVDAKNGELHDVGHLPTTKGD